MFLRQHLICALQFEAIGRITFCQLSSFWIFCHHKCMVYMSVPVLCLSFPPSCVPFHFFFIQLSISRRVPPYEAWRFSCCWLFEVQFPHFYKTCRDDTCIYMHTRKQISGGSPSIIGQECSKCSWTNTNDSSVVSRPMKACGRPAGLYNLHMCSVLHRCLLPVHHSNSSPFLLSPSWSGIQTSDLLVTNLPLQLLIKSIYA